MYKNFNLYSTHLNKNISALTEGSDNIRLDQWFPKRGAWDYCGRGAARLICSYILYFHFKCWQNVFDLKCFNERLVDKKTSYLQKGALQKTTFQR